ncbi:caveolin-2-like [Mytilus trossulus]|uniref:caveolin-2-like n=1 Tax=Mytilus trossulus TaxID=6551 RepID=UPI003004C020
MTTQAGVQAPKENRDPNHINDHLQMKFDQVFGEPENNYSFGVVWECSETCYTCWHGLCYGLASCLCSVWIVIYWGFIFGCVAFDHIWIFTPFLKLFTMIMQICRPLKPCIDCCIKPCTGACAHFFILFAEPGTDIDRWNKPVIKTPVRRVRINRDSPVPVKRTPVPAPTDEDLFLGQKSQMARSVQRQMML